MRPLLPHPNITVMMVARLLTVLMRQCEGYATPTAITTMLCKTLPHPRVDWVIVLIV